jgi:hypothetical protein
LREIDLECNKTTERKGDKMTVYDAIGLAEGFVEAESEEQVIEAWQFLLDTGMVWSLQGMFGRQAVSMIEEGILVVKDAKDIPEVLFV